MKLTKDNDVNESTSNQICVVMAYFITCIGGGGQISSRIRKDQLLKPRGMFRKNTNQIVITLLIYWKGWSFSLTCD